MLDVSNSEELLNFLQYIHITYTLPLKRTSAISSSKVTKIKRYFMLYNKESLKR